MTVDTILNIAMWIAELTITVLLVILAFCAIWFAIRTAWEYISQHKDHYVFFNPKPIETEEDKIKKRLNECERKINLLEDFVGATSDYIEQKRNSMRDLLRDEYGIDPNFHPHYDFSNICQQPEPIANNGIIIDGVAYAYKKAKLETKDGTICTTCALNAICNRMAETITCSVFKGSDEDGCHFERI